MKIRKMLNKPAKWFYILLGATFFSTLLLAQTITFEELAPQIVTKQYCNNLMTNQGVEFKSLVKIAEPSVVTSSGTQALMELLHGDDVQPYEGPTIISFTTGQSFVAVRVGLDPADNVSNKAVLRAYDNPEPGQGNKLTPNPDPSVNLGTGPTPIINLLSFGDLNGPSNIRRIEIEFVRFGGSGGQEVLDDLTFSAIGPHCLIDDNQTPIVQIFQPTLNQTINNPQTLLHLRVTDSGSGIMNVRVRFLNTSSAEIGAYLLCDQDCGFPNYNETEGQYYTYLPRDTRTIRVEATDFAGNTGWSERLVNLVLPQPEYNLWALGMEVTQVIQNQVLTSTTSRSQLAPQRNLNIGPPLVAGKRTVVRVYPGVEETTIPVVGARASLRCYTSLGFNEASSTPCDGPLGVDAVNPEITVDPTNDNNLSTLRLNSALSWNFILPQQWTTPGEIRFFFARIAPPLNLPECEGCRDGANILIGGIPAFQETAPLIIKPRFACVRRSANVPKENCDALASTPDAAADLAWRFLWGNDWDNDGMFDPFFNVVMPVADGVNGVKIRPPILYDYRDGDLNTPTGIMSWGKMDDYLFYLNDEFGLDWSDIWDPEWAVAYPKNWRQVAFVPPPTGPSGMANTSRPSAIAKVSLSPSRISGNTTNNGNIVPENDYCTLCPNDAKATIHWDEINVAHEIGHTFGIKHASCDHGEEGGGGCDPAPNEFPCPHGGICLSVAQPDEPVGFNTYNMGVILPRLGNMHAHDLMSYGGGPKWISRHNYSRIFQQLREIWVESSNNQALAGVAETADLSPDSLQMVIYVSGKIKPSNEVEVVSVYQFLGSVASQVDTGAYILELQHSNGQVLRSRRFTPLAPMDGEPGGATHFFQRLPFPPDTYRLVLKKDNNVLFERTRSPNAPVLNIIEPSGNVVWEDGMHTIRWRASDADGDSLVYTVQYSKDKGVTWRTLVLNSAQNSLEANAGTLGGGQPNNALIRIFASDGFNGVTQETNLFTIKDKSPYTRIQFPADSSKFEKKRLVNLIGGAIDYEDGTLGDESYRWQSNKDGDLGQGHELRLTNLSVGEHLIILTAQDNAGNSSSDSIIITILGRPNSQPIADAGPDKVVLVGTNVLLSGAASFDPDDDPLSYSWKFVSVPAFLSIAPQLTNPTSNSPDFLAVVPGKYVLELVVRDGKVNSFPVQVKIDAKFEGPAFQYAAKIVCGEQKKANDLRLVKGIYATTVNIHNPQDSNLVFFKKLALTYPPGGQMAGKILPLGVDTLGPDGALQTDCVDLKKLFPWGFPNSFIEGFVVIESPASLDVNSVYTLAQTGGLFSPPKATSIDIEQVRERIIEHDDVPVPELLPDLIPVPLPGCAGGAECFCQRRGDSLYVTIRNQGNAKAGVSITAVDFGNLGEFTVQTPEIDPGDEKKVVFPPIPSGCYTPNCNFKIKADRNAQVLESNETNNVANGICKG